MVEEQSQNGQENEEEEEENEEDATLASKMSTSLTKSVEGLPEWFVAPANFKAPPGRKIVLMRFRAEWTNAPEKGERQIVLWGLTEQEEQFASERAHGKDTRVIGELTKQCIRYIDGQRVDWTMTPGSGVNVGPFWQEIGSACRKLLIHYYVKAHTLTADEQLDFFSNCIVSTTSIPVG